MKRMIPLLLILALLTGCGSQNTDNSYNSTSTESKVTTYTRINSDEAAEMMSQKTDYIIFGYIIKKWTQKGEWYTIKKRSVHKWKISNIQKNSSKV